MLLDGVCNTSLDCSVPSVFFKSLSILPDGDGPGCGRAEDDLTIFPPRNEGAKMHSRRSLRHRAQGGLLGASISPKSHLAFRERCR